MPTGGSWNLWGARSSEVRSKEFYFCNNLSLGFPQPPNPFPPTFLLSANHLYHHPNLTSFSFLLNEILLQILIAFRIKPNSSHSLAGKMLPGEGPAHPLWLCLPCVIRLPRCMVYSPTPCVFPGPEIPTLICLGLSEKTGFSPKLHPNSSSAHTTTTTTIFFENLPTLQNGSCTTSSRKTCLTSSG